MNIVTLTLSDGTGVRINMNLVTCYWELDSGLTRVEYNDGYANVKETAEQIDQIFKECYAFVKRRIDFNKADATLEVKQDATEKPDAPQDSTEADGVRGRNDRDVAPTSAEFNGN